MKDVEFILANVDFTDAEKALEQTKMYKGHLIPFALTAFAAVPPIRNSEGKYSTDATLKNLRNIDVTTLNGAKISGDNVGRLLMMFFDIPRSRFIKNMMQNPRYASMTPLFLYAQKDYNNIAYEEWEKSDVTMKYALGSFLEPILNASSEDLALSATPEIIREARSKFCSRGVLGYTNTWPGVSKPINYMVLQTWLCNSQVRVPDAMILDPINWDNTPEAIDTVIEVEGKREIETKTTKKDLPW